MKKFLWCFVLLCFGTGLFFCQENLQSSEVTEDTKEKDKETILYGLDDDIIALLDEFTQNQTYFYLDEIFATFERTRSVALRDKIISYFTAAEDNRLKDYALEVLEDPFDTSDSTVSLLFKYVSQLKIEEGEAFSEQDIKTSAKVCLIGKTVKDNLFTNGEDPVGHVIRFNTIPLKVVGVLKSKGYNSFGMDQDDVVLAPYTTVMKRVLAVTYLQGINASAITEDITDLAIDDVANILRESHKIKLNEFGEYDDDFTIRSQKELSSMMNSTSDLMTTLLLVVACISLVVGGIGIMNIMYVSVTERTREIGLRMSVGARGIDILNQFLIEAVLLSVTGGIIGIMLGIGASIGVNVFAKWPIVIQPWSVFVSFLVCTATGVFFGWYPAKKAACLDPIEAIRYE